MQRRRHFSVHIVKPMGGKVRKLRNLPMKETSRGRIESKWWENTKQLIDPLMNVVLPEGNKYSAPNSLDTFFKTNATTPTEYLALGPEV